MAVVTELAAVEGILRRTRTVAVVGASSVPSRAGFYVGEYLARVGYRVYPVNPRRVGETIWGRPVLSSLAELPEPVDMVDMFRRSELIPGHVDEILALPWSPSVVWLQLLVWHPESAERLSAAGIDVVQNRCTMADHQRFGLQSLTEQ